MTSFLVCHKEVNRLPPSRTRAEEAPLAGLKEEGRLLPRPWITRTKPSRLGLAQGGGVVRRGLSVFSTLAIGFVWLATPLRAQFVYVANQFPSHNVSAYSIGANGALTPVPGSPFAAGIGASAVAVDPAAKFAYVANADGTVSAYSIGANGALTPVPGSPFAAGTIPESVAVDPTGKFAYVANRGNPDLGIPGNVSAYSIGANGALTQLTSLGSPFLAGTLPLSVAVDPTAKFAYVTNLSDNNVSAYSIGANGGLTPVLGSPFAAGSFPVSVAITPLVPFASSFAKLEIAKHRFDLKESFTLGANSNGINPLAANVSLQIGTFSVTIPAGSFEQKPNGRFDFKGGINDVKLKAQIVPLGNNIFTFNAEGKGGDLTGLTNPVTVVLTIGTHSGSTAVTTPFQ